MKKKKNYARKNAWKKNRENIFIIALIVLLVVTVAIALIQRLTQDPASGMTITADGHVHAADGTHLGTFEEMFGIDGYTVTEDGHLHDADGNHIGDMSDMQVIEEDDHDHAEGEDDHEH